MRGYLCFGLAHIYCSEGFRQNSGAGPWPDSPRRGVVAQEQKNSSPNFLRIQNRGGDVNPKSGGVGGGVGLCVLLLLAPGLPGVEPRLDFFAVKPKGATDA